MEKIRWLTLNQVRKIIGISHPTAQKLIKSGELAAYKIAGRYFVEEDELKRFLETARIKFRN